jgi:Ni,Fe-hydrogenase III large subunit/Ni,Fe-hydrogenase III component G
MSYPGSTVAAEKIAISTLTGGAELPARVPGETRVAVPVSALPAACAAVHQRANGRLATMVGQDDRPNSGYFRLAYTFALPGQRWATIEAELSPGDPQFPSVTPLVPAAHWYEREVRDMLGLEPVGHPDPRRLVMHDDWPDGVYPLRKDFDPAVPVPRVENEPYRFHTLHGEGIVEIPVGPIHAGVIEPGHFRFAAVGEAILALEPRLFYTHRGIEKLAEGKAPRHVLQIAERTCGVCSLSHAVAYCQAMEIIAGVQVPAKAQAIRTVALELERLYNHIGDLGNMCAGVGFAIAAAMGARLKDDLQRLYERLTGNRFLRGLCTIGGVRRDFSSEALADLESTLTRVTAEFGDLVTLILGSDTTMERFATTGVLPAEAARALGAVGIAARGSGQDLDTRRDHPYAAYDTLADAIDVPVRHQGDVEARARVRVDEAIASFSIIHEVLGSLPGGPIASEWAIPPGDHTAFSATESPRGENLHWVRVGEDGLISRYRIRSASYPNWPAVVASTPGNMVPDFPLINKSFELCYACLDR